MFNSKIKIYASKILFSLHTFSLVYLIGSMSGLSAEETVQYSLLWNEDGSNWPDSDNILRDFTDVGYKLGNEAIPDWPVWKSITEYGANPDDAISDVDALRQAIDECPPYHAIFIPNGKFIIDEQIIVTSDNIVIRGESRDNAILFFPLHMNEILQTDTSNNRYFIVFSGGQNRGIENLSLAFRDERHATGSYHGDPHWFFSGEAAITFINGETDSWIRNVYIKNSYHAIKVDSRDTKQISILDIVLDQFIGRGSEGSEWVGHMGILFINSPSRCLVHNVLITGVWRHDLCVMGVKDSVFSRIKGKNMRVDHHAGGNALNLYTEIDTGFGGRGFGGMILTVQKKLIGELRAFNRQAWL